MDIKKNDIFQLKIDDMSDTGEGIGRVDGYIWFVKDAVIGDQIEAKALKMKKNYGFARLMQVLEPSQDRTEALCPVARQCGGCQLQAMKYESQLNFKVKKVYNNLKRIGGLKQLRLPGTGEGKGVEAVASENGASVIMEPIIGMEHPWRYRNKAQFPFGVGRDGAVITGFYAGRTHCIIENEDCLLGIEENKKILHAIKKFMNEYKIEPYVEAQHRGLVRHALIRKGFKTGEIMVCLVINGKKLPHYEALVDELVKIPGMASISFNVNQEKTNVILGQEIVCLYGSGYITDEIGEIKYRISPLSFYQVNPIQTERLYETALEYAGLTGTETVWDLYCGIGTISLFLAQKAKMVYGVEIVPQAIGDARENAKLNGIQNVEFFVGKAEEVLPGQYEKNHVYADVIVVDPPRKGCDQICLDTIIKMAPKKVVYISCDSATLARDVKYLGENGYEVTRVRGCDMFAMSTHVETVVLLSRKKSTKPRLEITMYPDDENKREALKNATYPEIKDYIKNKYGVSVHTAYIAEVKREYGLTCREAFNKPEVSKREYPCPEDKKRMIIEALQYFKMVS